MSDAPHYQDDRVTLHHGDCLAVLRAMPDASVSAIVCDPPYGLADHKPATITAALTAWLGGDREHVPDGRGFMGRAWDGFVPPPAVWDECLRVLKPGGHLLAFAGSRTADLMGLAIRLAGFELRDTITWLYGSGFPKSLDVGKAIDKTRQSRDEVLDFTAWVRGTCAVLGLKARDLDALCGTNGMGSHWMSSKSQPYVPTAEQFERLRPVLGDAPEGLEELILPARKPGEAWEQRPITQEEKRPLVPGDVISFDQRSSTERERRDIPATDAACQWQGWGTALKPASEPIVVARKPLTGTVAATVLAHGTGALNVNGCRVAYQSDSDYRRNAAFDRMTGPNLYREDRRGPAPAGDPAGRWPTNVVLTHAPDCAEQCEAGCPVAELDAQSGTLAGRGNRRPTFSGGGTGDSVAPGSRILRDEVVNYGDSGGASRFFPTFRYQAKAPTSERPSYIKEGAAGSTGPIAASRCRKCGKQDLSGSRCQCPEPDWTREGGNKIAHPTVKPLALMRWLVRLVTPPDGVVLDPCAGSGTTVEAAMLEGFPVIAIEREADYLPLIVHRVERARLALRERAEAAAAAPALFDAA